MVDNLLIKSLNRLKSAILLLVIVHCSMFIANAQPAAYNHPELEWKTIESVHFKVHFHQGTERTARVVSKIAEEIYEPITSLYEFEPDEKMNLVIRDHDDYSNGGAFYFDNTIEIWASNLDYDLRGSHNWLRDVVTHEFVHMIQLQASRKSDSRRFPAAYLQVLAYEKEKRPDVIRGYPNVIASYPFPTVIVPLWFAEGVAQHQEKTVHFDIYDAHRDMIIRTRYLNDQILSYSEMGSFGKGGTGNESVYNQGYALTNFIVKKYGEKSIAEISKNLSSKINFSFESAVEKAIGISGEEVYKEWRKELDKTYEKRLAKIKANEVSGEKLLLAKNSKPYKSGFYCSVCAGHSHETFGVKTHSQLGFKHSTKHNFSERVESGGTTNLYPTWTKDGKKLAFISNFEGGGFFSYTSVYTYDFEKKEHKKLKSGVYSTPSWTPDGKKIVYARKGKLNKYKSRFSDLYIYDIETEEETRLTHDLRAFNPSVSPDGKKVAFSVNFDGTMNLVVGTLDSASVKGLKYLTNFENGEQTYYPKWSADGKQITFATSVLDGRDVAVVNSDGTNFRYILNSKLDERNPSFTPDGKKILYACDKSGIFNIFSYDLETGKNELLTNVTGSAFMPEMSVDGKIAYSEFAVDGYKIAILDNPKPLDETNSVYIENYIDTIPTRTFDDTTYPMAKATDYDPKLGKMILFPRATFDYGTFKPGVYGYWNGILNKYNFFWGLSSNKDFEIDAFSIIEYKFKRPTLFFELYYISRKLKDSTIGRATENLDDVINNETSIRRDFQYIFDLFEIDAGIREKVDSENDYQLAFVHSRYSTKLKFDTFIIDNVDSTTTFRADLSQFRYFKPEPYFLGYSFSSKWHYRAIAPALDRNINPHIGREFTIQIDNELNQFNRDSDFSISETGTLEQNRIDYFMSKLQVDYSEHMAVPFLKKWRHSLTANFKGGVLVGYNKNNIAPRDSISAFPEKYTREERTPDDYFNFFGGGFPGMKGYSYYALEGQNMAILNLNYRFPIIKSLDLEFLHLRFDKLYGSVFADIGNLWDNSSPSNAFKDISTGKSNLNSQKSYGGYDYDRLKDSWKDFKIDVGYQLRASLFSFFGYPTALEFSAAYGLTEFDTLVDVDPVSGIEKDRLFYPETVPETEREQGVPYVDKIIKNGGEWRYYFTVLFTF